MFLVHPYADDESALGRIVALESEASVMTRVIRTQNFMRHSQVGSECAIKPN